jgi:predicted nucleotidyltransferase
VGWEGCEKMMVKLKGENQIRKFRQVAEELVSKISSFEGVTGIVFIGGLVRGFADKFSDLDIIVFLSRRDEQLRRQISDLGLDEQRRLGIDVDLEVHFLEDFKKWKWDEVDKWDFSRAEVVFDPKGEIKKVFSEKLRVPKDFWIKRIVICGEYLKWYCCPSREEVGTVAESWIERGDLVAAHYCLNYAVDLLLRIVFALNREFLPAPKWRLFYSYSLKWLPPNYKELIKESMSLKSFSIEDFDRRLKAIRKMWHSILPRIENETGLTSEQISKYYVEKILHLGA